MATNDFRKWLSDMDGMKKLKRIENADWDLEIGCATALNLLKESRPVLLFDNIKGYPPGYRVVTCSISSADAVALTLNLSGKYSDSELVALLRQKLIEWEANGENFPPQWVKDGPVTQNLFSGADLDLFAFPTPKWHELDGGRYIGTGHNVITKDPDTGEVNIGTYRVMIHDRETVTLYISPGKHGRVHSEKYRARGQRCPVAISIGHHPVFFAVSCMAVPPGAEYSFIGAIRGVPVNVIKEEVTGLPIPADSEAVIAGWIPPGRVEKEGPFGEWTGYYGTGEHTAPVVEVERIYHRDDPILLGSPPSRFPSDSSYYLVMLRCALLYNELKKNAIPDVRDVWISEVGQQQLIVVSIKQRYAGHAKQAALLASQCRTGAYQGRYVIVVDDDINPHNIQDVLWALCTRSDPVDDIDIIRKAWSTPLDPMIHKSASPFVNSRAIIDACRPFERIEDFPRTIELKPDLVERVKRKWKGLG